MFGIVFLLNVAVLIAAELVLLWLWRRRRRLGGGLLLAFNLFLLVDLAPFLAPQLVYVLTNPGNEEAIRAELLQSLPASATTRHLYFDYDSVPERYRDQGAFSQAFTDPPCAAVCQDLIVKYRLSQIAFRFRKPCDEHCAGGPNPEKTYETHLIVQHPARTCGGEWTCRTTPIGWLSYRYSLGVPRNFSVESIAVTKQLNWLRPIEFIYYVAYIKPDNFPIRSGVLLVPRASVLMPVLIAPLAINTRLFVKDYVFVN